MSSSPKKKQGPPAPPPRSKLPDVREGITHRFQIGFGDEAVVGYLTVNWYPNGKPGEVFLTISKEGSALSGILDGWAVMVSLGLQHGFPLSTIIQKYLYTRFEPNGMTTNPDIPVATSILDYVARWLGMRFLTNEEREYAGFPSQEVVTSQQELLRDDEQEQETNAGNKPSGPDVSKEGEAPAPEKDDQ